MVNLFGDGSYGGQEWEIIIDNITLYRLSKIVSINKGWYEKENV